MYIWRGKNRRDKRNLLLGGDLFWGAEKGAKNFQHEDQVLRCELEEKHVNYFGNKVRLLMAQYLGTVNGKREVELVIEEQDKTVQVKRSTMLQHSTPEEEELLKANIFNMYESFCLPETTHIDRQGLKNLFSELRLDMTKRHFDQYMRKLKIFDDECVSDFETFFSVLMEELDNEGKAKGLFGMFAKKQDEEEDEKKRNASLAWKVHRRLQENAVKLLIIEEAVHRVCSDARIEFRRAHPSELICGLCDAAFSDAATLKKHTKDAVLHRQLTRAKVAKEERFKCVEEIFLGNQGRHLRANRLIFSTELGSLQGRIDAAENDPLRPSLADSEGTRYAQQMKGSMVRGFDPKAGIRPNFRRIGLLRQHHQPVRHRTNANSLFQVTHPQLQEIIHHLQRCKDDFIDTVSTWDNPLNSKATKAILNSSQQHDQTAGTKSMDDDASDKSLQLKDDAEAEWGQLTDRSEDRERGANVNQMFAAGKGQTMSAVVRFQWNMFADNQVYIIGEFTGWKPEEMTCSAKTSKFTIMKQLGPGRYRYRFIIDGVERVDEVASQVPDPTGPEGKTNEILVTSTPLFHVHHHHHHANASAANATAMTPLQAVSMKQSLEKSGLVLSPSAAAATRSSRSSGASGGGLGVGMGRRSSKKKQSAGSSRGMLTPVSEVGDNGMPQNNNDDAAAAAAAAADGDDESSVEERSLGAIVHISQTDKDALIRHLKHIELRNLALFDDGAWALAAYINRNSFIMSIDLSYNNISDDGVQGFAGCLPLLDALHTIKLNGNGFGVDACRYLCAGLAKSTTLTSLELANNRIGDDGVEALCNFAKHNEHLQSMHLDSNLIGDDGMECFHDALMHNRALRNVSLQMNRMTTIGINRFMIALQFNAALEHLNLGVNPLGPDGANLVGTCFTINDTILSLDLANINLIVKGNSYGLYGLCNGLARNKTLTRLNLRNNGIQSIHAVDIAHALMKNETLTELDLAGNPIDQKWFQDEVYIPTHIMPDMPSIELLLVRNRKHQRNFYNAFDSNGKPLYLDDVVRGKWTFRRRWAKEVQTNYEKQALVDAMDAERFRIDAEEEYVKTTLADFMVTVKLYLDQVPCRRYLQLVTKAVTQYMHDLGKFDSKLYNAFSLSLSNVPVLKDKTSRRNAAIQLKRSASEKNLSSRGSNMTSVSSRVLSPLKSMSLAAATPHLEQKNFHMESFLNAHISVIHAVFSQLNGHSHNGLMITPLLLQQAFHTLALPLPTDEVQIAVDATLVQAFNSIGLHKFSDYLLTNAQRLCRENRMHRMRILTDVALHPPEQEAKQIILDHLHHIALNEIREKYRKMPGNFPKFACPVCSKRFTKQSHLDRHFSKGANCSEHRRHRIKEVIHHAQEQFLQGVKHDLTHVFFPAYFELKPNHLLPKMYFPQVFDKIGKEGRPFGVVEANRTVRVLDVFGEYLHVMLEGELGWVRYLDEKQQYLQPACANQDGFDWDHLHLQDIPSYYRVNDILAKDIELKVRYQPLPEGEVIGYLKINQVIECHAVIGDWLQVRYEKEDAAWVRWRISTPESRAADERKKKEEEKEEEAARQAQAAHASQSMRSMFQRSLSFISDFGAGESNVTSASTGIGTRAAAADRGESGNRPQLGSAGATGGVGVRAGATTATLGSPLSKRRNIQFASPPSSRLGASRHFHTKRASERTPGDQHEEHDDMFGDSLLTYEINGEIVRANLKKRHDIDREKIEHFNRVRYGTSGDGTSNCTLLLLPDHFRPLIIPPVEQGKMPEPVQSPMTLTQQQLFDRIMAISKEERSDHKQQDHSELDRNEMFFARDESSSINITGKPTRGDSNDGNNSNNGSTGGTGKLASRKKRSKVNFRDDLYGVSDDEDKIDDSIEHSLVFEHQKHSKANAEENQN